jgi:hypothetical protein
MRRRSLGSPSPGRGIEPDGPGMGAVGVALGLGLGVGDGRGLGVGSGTRVGGGTGGRRRSSEVGGFENTKPSTSRTASMTRPAAGAGRRRIHATTAWRQPITAPRQTFAATTRTPETDPARPDPGAPRAPAGRARWCPSAGGDRGDGLHQHDTGTYPRNRRRSAPVTPLRPCARRPWAPATVGAGGSGAAGGSRRRPATVGGGGRRQPAAGWRQQPAAACNRPCTPGSLGFGPVFVWFGPGVVKKPGAPWPAGAPCPPWTTWARHARRARCAERGGPGSTPAGIGVMLWYATDCLDLATMVGERAQTGFRLALRRRGRGNGGRRCRPAGPVCRRGDTRAVHSTSIPLVVYQGRRGVRPIA